MSRTIVSSLITAVEDYAEFQTEELKEAYLETLRTLDTGMNEAGYTQSTREDTAAQKLEDTMNEADTAESEDEE